MKKSIKFFLLFILISVGLTSCKDQPINNGLYAIPVVLFAFAIHAAYQIVKGYFSGSKQQTSSGEVYGKWKLIPKWPLFKFIILTAVGIGISIAIHEENRKWNAKKDRPYPTAPVPDGRNSAEEQARIADSVYNMKK